MAITWIDNRTHRELRELSFWNFSPIFAHSLPTPDGTLTPTLTLTMSCGRRSWEGGLITASTLCLPNSVCALWSSSTGSSSSCIWKKIQFQLTTKEQPNVFFFIVLQLVRENTAIRGRANMWSLFFQDPVVLNDLKSSPLYCNYQCQPFIPVTWTQETVLFVNWKWPCTLVC